MKTIDIDQLKDQPKDQPIDQPIVCRCEDITEAEVQEALDAGMETLEELKRALRVGMGPCQGRTCGPILASMLARHLGKRPSEIETWNQRAPLKPVPANVFFEEGSNE